MPRPLKAQPGTTVGLYLDSIDRLQKGDFVRSQTGRTYLIETVRVQARGRHIGRQHLRATVMPPDFTPEQDDTVFDFRWYRR